MISHEFQLFQQALRKIRKGNAIAEQLLEQLEHHYKQSGLEGVESLIRSIRQKYVESLYETQED